MKRITMLLGAGILLLCSMIYAAVPQLINFQGILRDGSGNPVANGSYSVQFTIYDAAVAGTNLWSETQSVTTVNGLFTVLLGSGPIPLDYSIFNDSTRWLGVKVGADPEMTPRQRLSSVGYSHNSSEWTSAAQDLFRLSGNVGIGTTPFSSTKLYAQTDGTIPTAFHGTAAGHPSENYGVMGNGFSNASADCYGGYFYSTSSGGTSYGAYGSGGSYGMYGTGGSYGVYGKGDYSGVWADNTNNGYGLRATSNYDAIWATTNGSSVGSIYGTYSDAYNLSSGTAYGGYFYGSSLAGIGYGVYAYGNGPGVVASGGTNGVEATGASRGIYATGTNYGVVGGGSTAGTGVYGSGRFGLTGVTTAGSPGVDGYGVYGSDGDILYTWAGYFHGPVRVDDFLIVDGFIYKNGGGFRIDHPTDPANKYLYHSFVESPDMKNIYDGVVTTDSKGEATVALPDWFGALNRDFRYQLTAIGQFAQAIVSKEISNNRFSIQTDKPNVKVSWQVTGIRKDAYAEANRIPVEVEKTGKEKGKYLQPEAHGAPASLGMHYEESQKMTAERKQHEEQQAKMEAERKLHEEERAKMAVEQKKMEEQRLKMEQERVTQEQKTKEKK